jgi:HAE1 family hydrophobic/amphiphilic exporter-1
VEAQGDLEGRGEWRFSQDGETVEVAQRVLAQVQAVNRAFPQVRLTPVINQGNFIERAIANVARSLLYGGSLAVLVLLFFLRDLCAARSSSRSPFRSACC